MEYAPEGVPVEQWVLAVDSTRLAAVATWRDAWSPEPVERLARLSRPDIGRSVEFSGRRLTVELVGDLAGRSPAVAVTAGLSLADGTARRVPLGELGFGPQALTARVELCADGCKLTDLRLTRLPGEIGGLTGSVTFQRLSVDGEPLGSAFAEPSDWRSTRLDEVRTDSSPITQISVGPAGLRMAFNAAPSAQPGIVRTDVPEALPVLAVGSTFAGLVGRDDLVRARSINGTTTLGLVTSRPAALPGSGWSAPCPTWSSPIGSPPRSTRGRRSRSGPAVRVLQRATGQRAAGQ